MIVLTSLSMSKNDIGRNRGGVGDVDIIQYHFKKTKGHAFYFSFFSM